MGMLGPVSDGEAVALLEALVSAPSPSGKEQLAAKVLATWMQGHGVESSIDGSGSVVGIRGHAERVVMMLGHIDTFPGIVPVRYSNGQLYGRGTVDAKGPLAAFAVAAARAQVPPGLALIVIGATEEESATSRGARQAASTFKPYACLIGEPSRWDRITLGYRGRLNLSWTWEGGLGHSAGPGLSPAEVAVETWQRMKQRVCELNGSEGSAFNRLDASLREIRTGRRGLAGWAQMDINVRIPPGMETGRVEAALSETHASAEYRFWGHEQPYLADRDTLVTRALRGAIRDKGGKPRFVLKTGTSDMNVVGPVWNCPIAAYGPGDSSLDHTSEEHVVIDEYLTSIHILEATISRLMTDVAESAESHV